MEPEARSEKVTLPPFCQQRLRSLQRRPPVGAIGGRRKGTDMDEINTSLVWSPTSDGGRYPRHRIPGIVVTRRGTVIVYCEARTGITEYSL